ncbi:MAG: hypothetical protein ACI9WU_000073 [Myxococcota bacterium]|jgi:hypothetical protein
MPSVRISSSSVEAMTDPAPGRIRLATSASARTAATASSPPPNGRTARAIAYLVLCMDLGSMIPGVPTVPTLIYDRRVEYVTALQAADAGVRATGDPDLAHMTAFVTDVVTQQMAQALNALSGTNT